MRADVLTVVDDRWSAPEPDVAACNEASDCYLRAARLTHPSQQSLREALELRHVERHLKAKRLAGCKYVALLDQHGWE